jgi:hypothetical protein
LFEPADQSLWKESLYIREGKNISYTWSTIKMSRLRGLSKFFPIFAIALLVLSVTSPALVEAKVHTSPATTDGPAIPAIISANINQSPAGNATINATAGTLFSQGHAKIGNLHTPPAIVSNLTQKIKKQVNDVRLNAAKKIAEGKINLITNQLQLYNKRVDKSGLSDDQKSDIKAIVDANIAWFRQLEDEIQAADDMAEVEALASQIDQQANLLMVTIKKEAGIMACDGLDARIATARNASGGIADRIAALNIPGEDRARIEQRLADYDTHVDNADGYSLAARTAFEGITSADNTDSGFNEGYRQIGLADREMNQAYIDLKAVYLWYLQACRTT